MHCCSWPPVNIDATRHVEIKDTAEKLCGRANIAFRAEQNPTDSCWKNGTTNDDSNATSNIQQHPATPCSQAQEGIVHVGFGLALPHQLPSHAILFQQVLYRGSCTAVMVFMVEFGGSSRFFRGLRRLNGSQILF